MNGRKRNRALAAGIAGAAALGMTLTIATAAPSGSLTPVEEQISASLSNAQDVTVSPDGLNVYGAGFASGEIGVFERSATTGAITFDGNVEGDGLTGPEAVVISPDGDNAYVAGDVSDSVHAYDRNAGGDLSFLDAEFDGMNGADGLNGAFDVAVSPDGDHVYASGSEDNAVALLGRQANGSLQWQDAFINGLEGINNMQTPRGIAISPDGRNVYVAGADDGSVVTFKRFAGSGQLDFVESDAFASQSQDVQVSPDGTRVYVGFDDGIRTFRRNATTGALTLLGLSPAPSSTVFGVAVSPDGGNVYATADDISDGVATLAATPGSALKFVELDVVSEFSGMSAASVSPDGRHVYASGGSAGDGHIAVFSRQPELELKGKRKQKASKLKVKAECSADCKVKVKGKGIKTATKRLETGQPKKVRLKLKGDGPAGGKVKVKGKAIAGNRSDTDRFKIKLK